MQQQSVSCQQTRSGSSVTAWPGVLTQKAEVSRSHPAVLLEAQEGNPQHSCSLSLVNRLCAGSCFFPGKPGHSGVRRMTPCQSKVFVFC